MSDVDIMTPEDAEPFPDAAVPREAPPVRFPGIDTAHEGIPWPVDDKWLDKPFDVEAGRARLKRRGKL